jgi:Rrf2 family protein
MLKLSKKLLFAVEAVVDIAYHGGSLPVQSQDITRRQGIPRRYLEQALQQLVRAKILKGARGPRGGYNLAIERRRISVSDIVGVVNNQDTNIDDFDEPKGSELTQAVIRPFWDEIQNDIILRLNRISIDDLCQNAQNAGVVSEGRQSLDFTI